MTAIDISAWNGHPDFGQVKASGVTLVIPKAVDLERGYPVVDSTYYANRAAIRAAGLRCGSYLFNGPDSPQAGADYYFSVIDWKPGEVTAIDVENALGVNRWNPAQVLEFCTELIKRGVPAGSIFAYMSSSVTRAYDWSPVVALGIALWVAQYNANDGTVGTPPTVAHWGSWALWQHTSVAIVPGISGHVDMNVIGTAMAGLNSTPITDPLKPKEDTMLIRNSARGDFIVTPGIVQHCSNPAILNILARGGATILTVNDDEINAELLALAPGFSYPVPDGTYIAPFLRPAAATAPGAAIDYAAIAKAVNDDAAARLAS